MKREHDTSLAHTIITHHLGAGATAIELLSGGFFSRAYSASIDGRNYIVRINAAEHARESFEKDDYAWRHFGSGDLPVPRMVALGELSGEWYALSERAQGMALSAMPAYQRNALLPAMVDTLGAITNVDIGATEGYGDWDGTGRYRRWTAFLAQVMENEPDGYYENWHALFETSFLERDVYERAYQRMMELTAFCPDTRALVHNDLQFENILSDGQQITGVIDWANSLYGDSLYEVARWLWWTGTPGWFSHGDDLIRIRFGEEPNFNERITCYQLHIGLDDMKFCAKNGLLDYYITHRNRLLALVAGA